MSSTWMEALHAKHTTETAKTKNTRSSRISNRRHKRHRSQNIAGIPIATPIVSAAKASEPVGFLQSMFETNASAIRYKALNQTDIEKADRIQSQRGEGDNGNWESASEASNSTDIAGGVSDSGGSSSTSVEDLFVSRPKRKLRRKMARNGTYSMRETFENSRQVCKFIIWT